MIARASCLPKTLKNASSSMIRLMFIRPGLISCRAQSKLVPWATGPIAPIIWLGTSKNSNILNQPSAPARPRPGCEGVAELGSVPIPRRRIIEGRGPGVEELVDQVGEGMGLDR